MRELVVRCGSALHPYPGGDAGRAGNVERGVGNEKRREYEAAKLCKIDISFMDHAALLAEGVLTRQASPHG